MDAELSRAMKMCDMLAAVTAVNTQRLSAPEPPERLVGCVRDAGIGFVKLPKCLCCSPHQQIAIRDMPYRIENQLRTHRSPPDGKTSACQAALSPGRALQNDSYLGIKPVPGKKIH